MPTLEIQPVRTSVPSAFGAWERRGRTLGAGARVEPSLVVWLQVGRVFADVRLPRPGHLRSHLLDRSRAFSGTLQIDDGQATWSHDLDTLDRRTSGVDCAHLEHLGPEMVERGEGYVEYWRRCAPANAKAAALELGPISLDGTDGPTDLDIVVKARLVRVGAYAAAVWSQPKPGGGLFERRPGLSAAGAAITFGPGLLRRWAVVGLVGSPDGGRTALAALAALDEGGPLPEGWRPPT